METHNGQELKELFRKDPATFTRFVDEFDPGRQTPELEESLVYALSTLIKEKFYPDKCIKLLTQVISAGTDLERIVNLYDNLAVEALIFYLSEASRSMDRKCAIQALQQICSSVWTRTTVPKALKQLFPDEEDQQKWIHKVGSNPLDIKEGEWWAEILQNTGLKFTPKPGKPWYSPSEFPFLQVLEDNFDVIKQEAEALRDHQEKLVPWPEKFIIKNGWDVFGLYAFENRLDKLCEICPKTTQLLESIPGLQTALFSCLKPRCHIKPHIGYYMYSERILRVHLGIVVPEGCVLKVNGEEHNWEIGKLIVFDDTFLHEAWNPSYDTTRIVLMFDILVEVDPGLRNPEFWATAERQKVLGSDSLISNDLLSTISSVVDDGKPLKNVQERPKYYL